MKDFFERKRILVTGGTGSIGSELVRRLLDFKPEVVRVFSRDETKQYEFRQELGDRRDVRFLIGDVRDQARLVRALDGIHIVFHTAGMKHVPACEYNPFEAVQNNVIGTQNVLLAAIEAGVDRLVAISTDKATSPANTMGATKLLAERIVSSAHGWARKPTTCCVRFGNVMGSRGSVIPLLRRTIEVGGPVTLTDERMTRFMMTIPEAVDLVLRAASRAHAGEVFILKMPALRVADLVAVAIEQFAPRYGRKPEDIIVEIAGVRAGEKLDEALLAPHEQPRAEELEDMFVIHSFFDKEFDPSRTRQPEASEYVSSRARLLSKEEILQLMKKANVL